MYRFVEDDGLTDRQCDAAYCRHQEGVARRRPSLEELQQLHQRLAEHAGEPLCRRCQHPARAHEHYRPSEHCGWCDCRQFRYPPRRWWPR